MRHLFEEYGFALVAVILLVCCVALFFGIFDFVSNAYTV